MSLSIASYIASAIINDNAVLPSTMRPPSTSSSNVLEQISGDFDATLPGGGFGFSSVLSVIVRRSKLACGFGTSGVCMNSWGAACTL
jgi:hypothetical protein